MLPCLSLNNPVTQFCPNVDSEAVKDEFQDLQLPENDTVMTRVDGHQRRLDKIWRNIMAMRTTVGVVRFLCIATLFTVLLGLPHSNTDSMPRKIHTDRRSSLQADTITAYLQCKMNLDSYCHELVATPTMR